MDRPAPGLFADAGQRWLPYILSNQCLRVHPRHHTVGAWHSQAVKCVRSFRVYGVKLKPLNPRYADLSKLVSNCSESCGWQASSAITTELAGAAQSMLCSDPKLVALQMLCTCFAHDNTEQHVKVQ